MTSWVWCLTSRIRIKPNQSVLMRFTGKWGRGQKPAERLMMTTARGHHLLDAH